MRYMVERATCKVLLLSQLLISHANENLARVAPLDSEQAPHGQAISPPPPAPIL